MKRGNAALKNLDSEIYLEENICTHIFTVSATLVGVCLTVIGLIRVIITLKKIDTLADDLLAVDAILFLVSCLLSYWAMRSHKIKRMHQIERFADGTFILALLLMAGVCGIIAFEIISL